MDTTFLMLICLFIVAGLYSSVGHGGASGYLAVLILFNSAPATIKSTALMLNLVVSGIAFISFYKAKYFRFGLLWPFVITSVPAAYIGAKITINPSLYKVMLGFCLLIAVARMLYKPSDEGPRKRISVPAALLIGSALGFLSGMIGIGGGIILSPLLIIAGWASVKEAAAVSAPFIFLNSFAGLTGLISSGTDIPLENIYMILVTFLGGILGSYLGSNKLSFAGLRYILTGILSFAAMKLFLL